MFCEKCGCENPDGAKFCSECGENPVVPGQELCAYCLKERANNNSDVQSDESVVADAANLGDIDSVSTMDEIELDIGDDMDDEGFADGDDAFFDDDDDSYDDMDNEDI